MNPDEKKEKWQNIQKRSYTNWINEVLRPSGEVVNDIVNDLGSGVLLCKLAMLLTMKKIRYQKTPKLLFQRQENIQKALNLIEQSGCKLINIGASDILTKNTKLILGLMWQLVQHFHVFQSIKNVKKFNQSMKEEQLMGTAAGGDTDEICDTSKSEKKQTSSSIKKQILADINKRTAKRGVTVENLTTDWRDGEALCALVDYNVNGIYDLHQDSDPVLRVAESMIAAYKFLGIPQLIEPEDFISNLIDEQTMSMYISCFIHEGIEEISVDLFEGISAAQAGHADEEVGDLGVGLVRTGSVVGPTPGKDTDDVLEFIQETESKASDPGLKSVGKNLLKIVKHLPTHSLNEILAPRPGSASSSEPDEGIESDILADVSSSLQPHTKAALQGEGEDVIEKVSLEASLPPEEPAKESSEEASVAIEPGLLAADVADVLEEEIQLATTDASIEEPPPPIVEATDIKIEMCAPVLSDTECPSPGEVNPDITLQMMSPINQDEIRKKLGANLNATISDEISSILGDNESEKEDSKTYELENPVTETEIKKNEEQRWPDEDVIPSTSLEDTILPAEDPALGVDETVEGKTTVTYASISIETPSLEAEVPTPDVKVPSAEVEVPPVQIEAPAIEVPASIETPTLEAELPTPDVEVPSAEVEVPPVEIEAPAVEVSASVETPTLEAEVPTPDVEVPAVDVAASSIVAAVLDNVALETPPTTTEPEMPPLDIETPVEVELPTAEIGTPAVDIAASGIVTAALDAAIETSPVDSEAPVVEINVEKAGVTLETEAPPLDTEIVEHAAEASTEVEVPSIEVLAPEAADDAEVDVESLPSIDLGFVLHGEYRSDGEMVIPTAADEPISVKDRKYSMDSVGSEDSGSEKRISVAGSKHSSTNSKSKGGIISGGDEISVASTDIKDAFPALDSRLLTLMASMDAANKGFDGAKDQFKKFIARSDVDYRSVSFLKCCQTMRNSLLAAEFNIMGAGEHVMFDDAPSKEKKGLKIGLKKNKKKTDDENVDPLLAQLPKSASLKRGTSTTKPLSKKQMQRQKDLGNTAINLYTEVIQYYQNFKTLLVATQAAQHWDGPKLDRKYLESLDVMQEEVMMASMILTGQCSID